MPLIYLVKLKGPMDIPELIIDLRNLEIRRRRRVWKPFMEKYNCQTICEIGVFEGQNFEQMIEHKPKVAVAVDAWSDDGIISRHDSGYSQSILDQQYQDFVEKMADKPFVQIHREYSFDAAKHFPDEYFDLIYIDADHTYEACLKDIEDWYPKVKKGRIISGDDYRNALAPRTRVKFGVIKAVNTFAQAHNLTVYELPRYGWAIIKP